MSNQADLVGGRGSDAGIWLRLEFSSCRKSMLLNPYTEGSAYNIRHYTIWVLHTNYPTEKEIEITPQMKERIPYHQINSSILLSLVFYFYSYFRFFKERFIYVLRNGTR